MIRNMVRHTTRMATFVALLAPALPAPAVADTMAERFAAISFRGEEAPVAPSGARANALPRLQAVASRPTLKAEVAVTGDIVRIGDLIENAGAVADVAIFRAPDIGHTGSVPASRVIEAVRAHHIIGLDTRGIGEVVVTRTSRIIAAKDFEARIVRALAGRYALSAAEDLTVAFDNEARTLHVEPGTEPRIARLTFDPRSRRFDVTFELPGSTVARRIPLRFTGTLNETFEAAVLTRPVATGETLKASDFTFTRRPKAELAQGLVTSAEQAIGLAPRRPLRAGQVVRQADLMRPELVGRNESVTITYEVPGIRLTMRGQALEAGAQGDVINVLNVQSKKTIIATVIGPGRVSANGGAVAARTAANAGSRRPISSSKGR